MLTENVKKIVRGRIFEKTTREEFWALRNVSFKVDKGSRIGIIGKNGAGKSTLLKLLSRITEPSEGKIKIRGRVASLLEVGTGFHPELTGRENIFLNGAILGMSRVEIKKKFRDIVEFSGIEKFLDTPVKRYSSGMYVRLAFAVAAHLDPEILLIDEVLAVGDIQFQKKCLGRMDELSKSEGRTILFVSHNMGAIKNLCTQCILIEKGTIVQNGDVEKVLEKYISGSGKDLNQNGIVDLRLNERNILNSPLKSIEEGWIETYDGKVSNNLLVGTPFKVCFRFKAPRIIHDPVPGIVIRNVYGEVVTSIYSRHKDIIFKDSSSGIVVFELGSVPLMPGRYEISIHLYENVESYVDIIRDALTLTIIPAGEGPMKNYSSGGIFYIKADDIKLLDY